jgi:small-conductance mechanosensitive channel
MGELINATKTVDEFERAFTQILPYLWVAFGIVVTVLVAVGLRFWLRRSVKHKLPRDVYSPLEKAIIYTVVIVGVIASLSPLGISLTGLLVAGGFAGIVIGFATQTVVANLFSGLFLYIERPFRIGDPIKVMDYSGIIEDISIMSTRIRGWDGVLVRVPNDKLFNSDIVTYAKGVARRISYEIGISYDSDIDKAIEALKGMLEEHPMVLVNPPYDVLVKDYGDSAIVLEVRAWAPTNEWFTTYMDLLKATKKVLDEAGITIPYPQLDLHVKEEVRLKHLE